MSNINIRTIKEEKKEECLFPELTFGTEPEYLKIIKDSNVGFYILSPENQTFIEEFGENLVFLIIAECLKQGVAGFARNIVYDGDLINEFIEKLNECVLKRTEDQLFLADYEKFSLLNISAYLEEKNIQLLLDTYSVEELLLNGIDITVHSILSMKFSNEAKRLGSAMARLLDVGSSEALNETLTIDVKTKLAEMFVGIMDASLAEEGALPLETSLLYLSLVKCRMNSVRYVSYSSKKVVTKSIGAGENLLKFADIILKDLGMPFIIGKYILKNTK